MRLFELEAICENYLARCRRSALKKQQRESEEEDAEAAIAEHEEDRSPAAQAKKIWARAPYIACHGRLSRSCKRLPLILDRASTPACLGTLRPALGVEAQNFCESPDKVMGAAITGVMAVWLAAHNTS